MSGAAKSESDVHVIVHAGYHKTGTTTLQDFMKRNEDALKPFCTYYGKVDFMQAGSAARIYAQKRFPWRLYRFRKMFRAFLDSIPNAPTIVFSRETFTGNMPGHRSLLGRLISGYETPSRALSRVIIAELRRRFGADVKITYFLTTRATEPWIKSVHGHLLRSINLQDDLESFRARFPNLRGPEDEAATLARIIAPVPVVTSALEETATQPCGVASGLLDLLGVPLALRDTLQQIKRPANSGQNDAQRAKFLELNRSVKNKSELRHQKEVLMKQTWPRERRQRRQQREAAK